MLPPPITTPIPRTTTMDLEKTTITTTPNHNSIQQPQDSAFLYDSRDNATNSSATAAASAPKASNNATQRLREFWNRTLANVSKTNVSDYTTQYFASPPVTRTANAGTATSSPQLPSSRGSGGGSGTYDDIVYGSIRNGVGFVGNISEGFDSYVTAAAAADMAITTLTNTTRHLETTTAFPTAQTVATFIAGNKNRATTIIVYPTGT